MVLGSTAGFLPLIELRNSDNSFVGCIGNFDRYNMLGRFAAVSTWKHYKWIFYFREGTDYLTNSIHLQ